MKNIGLASVIIADLVLVPIILGGVAYAWSSGKPYQQILTVGVGFVGLVIGFVRVLQILKTLNTD